MAWPPVSYGPPMRVSCVISTHARPALLAEALGSVAAQTRPPDEVLVVDDAEVGDEETVERVRRVGDRLPVRYLHRPSRAGASASRNAGATAATGDLLAFLDDDDLWAPGYLAAVQQALESVAAPLVVTWITRFRRTGAADGAPLVEVCAGRRIREGLAPTDVLVHNPGVTGSNLVIARAVFDRLGGYDVRLPVSNDKDLFWRLLREGVGYTVVARPLVFQRHHAGARLTRPGARYAEGLRRYRELHAGDLDERGRRELDWMIVRAQLRSVHGLRRARLVAEGVRLVGPRALRRERLRWTPLAAHTCDLPLQPAPP